MIALKRALAAVAAVLFLTTGAAHACGPWLPYAYIAYGDNLSVLQLPCTDFQHELEAILGMPPASTQYSEPSQAEKPTWKTRDAAELTEALHAQGFTDPAPIVQAYLAFREETRKCTVPPYSMLHLSGAHAVPAHLSADPFPSKLLSFVSATPGYGLIRPIVIHVPAWEDTLAKVPAEFAFYARGAAAYANYDFNTAISWWRQVLALPADQRPYRTVWAAFMIARVQTDLSPEYDPSGFQQAIALADAGFRDSWRLAATACRWLAGNASYRGDTVATLHYFTELYRRGYPGEQQEAYRQLKLLCNQILTADPVAPEVARDPLCQRIITAWLISYEGFDDGDERLTRWLEAMRGLPSDTPIGGVDYLAWFAYHAGNMEQAAAWADLAGPDALPAQWVKSKLLLREGKTAEAAVILSRIAKAFPESHTGIVVNDYSQEVSLRSEASEDLGILLLSRKDYVGALDALMHTDYWLDTAYVAERVLTIEELKKYTDALGPATPEPPDTPRVLTFEDQAWQNTNQQKLRSLLGRRLARAGRYEEAKAYVNRDTRVMLDTLIGHLTQSKIRKTKEERAEALIQAAEHMREHGFEMMATELDPDWFYFDGYYEMESPQEHRFAKTDPQTEYQAAMSYSREIVPPDEPALSMNLLRALAPSQDEQARVQKSAPSPDKRFHYRYFASDLMWQAARLLPANDERTARALYLGGTYLARRDPPAADRFYKELVRRCRNLEIGKQAEALHWFPETNE